MKRTTISLPDDLAKITGREAERRGISVSELAREALTEHLGLTGKRRKVPFANLGDSGHGTVARDHEEILARELTRDFDRGR